jgi:IS5 family transposase
MSCLSLSNPKSFISNQLLCVNTVRIENFAATFLNVGVMFIFPMENRNGLIVSAKASLATGTAERDTAIEMLAELPGSRRKTVGADKGYDTQGFTDSCRGMGVTPHVAQNDKRRGGSAIDGRTTRHEGYQASMKVRKRIEEGFGWGKTIGLIRQVKVRGLGRVNAVFNMTFIGWNLTRMVNLQEQSV